MREFDACGIGFVADAQGRASRAIVAAALHGLACVKHRGAAAADGLTSDGCGVLTPIPAGPVRGGQRGHRPLRAGRRRHDPGRGRLCRRGRRGGRLAQARDRRHRPRPHGGRDAARDPPGGHRSADGQSFQRRGHGLPDPPPPDRCRRPLRRVLLLPDRRLQEPGRRRPPGRLLPGPRRPPVRGRLHHLPPAVLDQHAAHLGTGPALPQPVPQRRDQRHPGQPEPHAGPVDAGHRRGRPRRRGPVPAGARRQHVGLGQAGRGPRAAHPGRARHPPRRGHARARGLGARRRPRSRGPRLLPLPLRARWSPGTARPA